MQKNKEISEYRARLDETLASTDFTNEETLKSLIKKQLCSSSQECNEYVLDRRTADVSNILDKLRSASVKDPEASRSSEAPYNDWKLKHDYEDCRVMYCEGLRESPFHNLLVEGYVDGPVEDCLCVSWESRLYNKWWPQSSFPSFKILQNMCLQKVRINEQICLMRMKVPWPLTDREAVVHFFLFEHFKDGLIIVVMNTISDLEGIELPLNEFTKNSIPEAQNAVRIELVGGFALQKVTSEKSFFRTIAELDIKVDLIPPSLINFISRQLIGNGFRLYKKAVASVAKFDEDYGNALVDPLYTEIREALYSNNKPAETREENELNTEEHVLRDEIFSKMEGEAEESKSENDMKPLPENEKDEEENEGKIQRRGFSEIEEEECEEREASSEDDTRGKDVILKSEMDEERRFCISPEVEQALGTLERVISMVRKCRRDTRPHSSCSSSFSDVPNMAEEDLTAMTLSDISKRLPAESQEANSRGIGSSSFGQENHHNRIAPASSHQHLTASAVTRTNTIEINRNKHDPRGKNTIKLQRKHKVCCFPFKSLH